MRRALTILAFAVSAAAAPAPPLQGKITGGFQAPTTVDPQGRRSVVKGMDATPQGSNVYLITQPQVTSFNPDNTPEMFINAERCLLNMQSTVASSDSKLSMRTADNRFALQGTGWQWDPRSSFLVISNEVAATVVKEALQAGLTNRPAAATGAPVRITSARFQQDGDSASFIGDVVVQDGPDTLRCARLNLAFTKPDGLQQIEAIQKVELTQGETTVRSGHALYDLKANLLTITKEPAWTAGQREGSAEKLVLDRAKDTLTAEGNVFMKLPLTNAVSDTETAAAARRFAEIRSDHFFFQNATSNSPAQALYRQNVRVTHEQGSLTAAELAAGFGPDERLQSLDAKGGVTIESDGRRAFGERGQYDLVNEKISLSGNPRWEMEERKGTSEAVIFYPKTKELYALGQVEMFFPAGSGGSLLPGAAKTARNGDELMRITAATFSHQTNISVFNQAVRVEDARGTIDCELLTVVTGASNQVQRIIAQNDVRLAQKDMTATGDRAEYDMSTGLVRLTGNPELIGPDKRLRSDAFVINRAANTFSVAPGNYRIELKLKKKEDRASARP